MKAIKNRIRNNYECIGFETPVRYNAFNMHKKLMFYYMFSNIIQRILNNLIVDDDIQYKLSLLRYGQIISDHNHTVIYKFELGNNIGYEVNEDDFYI